MEKNTTYTEVINSFHSTFQDKVLIPEGLEKVWFLKAVGKYSFEIDSINFDEELNEFDSKLKRYANFIKNVSYQKLINVSVLFLKICLLMDQMEVKLLH